MNHIINLGPSSPPAMFALLRRLVRRANDDSFTLSPVTPEQTGCNDLLAAFCESPLTTLDVSCAAVARSEPSILRPLHALDFGRVRNRFRVLCNLNPGSNRAEDQGLIRFSYLTKAGRFRDAEIEAVFPASADRFTLRKRAIKDAAEA